MRVLPVLIAVAVLAASAVCVRLGFWQLARWREKQALNAALRATESTTGLEVSGEPPPAAAALNRSMRVTGRYDETRQFLLSGMLHEGEPGVEVVTPLRVAGATTAILVNRGWLPADDAMTARPQDHPEPGECVVEGVAEAMKHGAGPPGPRALAVAPPAVAPPPGDSLALYTVRWLDADSIAARLPYPLAGYVVRQRPGAGVPGLPRRTLRPLYDETMHLGYAIQWFLFAILIPGGTAILARSRRRRAASRSTEATT
jgi:surfeit locus 1 family protein